MAGECLSYFGFPQIFLLFSLFFGILGDCGPAPVLKDAYQTETIKDSYKTDDIVFYRCNKGNRHISTKNDFTKCRSDSSWDTIEEFCELGCQTPLQTRFSVVNHKHLFFYPVGLTVHYICRRGADPIPGHPTSPPSTCLSNYTWSTVPDFCTGKSCGDPGKPDNGDAIIQTDFLLRAKVNFTCKEGYKLIGSPTIQCQTKERTGNDVEWKPKPPICFRATCSPPPEIKNGKYDERKTGNFPFNSTVTYTCDLGFSLFGDSSLHCITEDNVKGIWKGPVPECKETTHTTITTSQSNAEITQRISNSSKNNAGCNIKIALGDWIIVLALLVLTKLL